MAHDYGLLDYLCDWHPWTPAERDRVVHAMLNVFQKLDALNLMNKLSISPEIVHAWRQVGGTDIVPAVPQIGGLEHWLQKLAPCPQGAAPANIKKTPLLPKPQPAPAPAKPGLLPTAGHKWYPGQTVLHDKRGKGMVRRTQVINNRLWIVVEFLTGSVALQAEPPYLHPLT